MNTTSAGAVCSACQSKAGLPVRISTAFQPIVQIDTRSIYAYEALVRGSEGQPASWVFEQITEEDHYQFDQECRVTAIRNAARLNMNTRLSINILPNAVYNPRTCIQTSLRAANEVGFPLDRLIFEVTEHESVLDQVHVRNIIDTYRDYGFITALDDYGAGHATAQLLVAVKPDLLKLDLSLIRGVESDVWQQALIRAHVAFAHEVGVLVIAEGVETPGEARILSALGVTHMQGYYFARPAFEALPEVPEDRFDQMR